MNERPVRNGRPRQRGFTLIEAIVALVLIATTGMALFGWVNSNIITLSRVQEANAVGAATANVVDYMNTVNPMATPSGEVGLGEYRLSWQATPIVESRDGAGFPYGVSAFQLALYQTQVKVQRRDGLPWFDFTLQQVGYKKVRGDAGGPG